MKKLLFFGAIIFILSVGVFVERKALAREALLLGNTFFMADTNYDLNKAGFFYRTALFLDPQVKDAWHQRARIDFLNADFDGALQKIDTQIALHGDSFMASYYIRALVHGYRKEWSEAQVDFKKFLTWDPESWAARNDLAWVYFAQGKFSDAEREADEGLEANPQNPWLLMTRGMARFNLGDLSGARDDLEKAKRGASVLAESEWHRAYPGNDPAFAPQGLNAFRSAIEDNLSLVNSALARTREGV